MRNLITRLNSGVRVFCSSPPAEEPTQTACPEEAAGSGWLLTQAPGATQSGCWQHTQYLDCER